MVKDPARNELADPPSDASVRRAEPAGIYEALATASGEVGAIAKDRENTAQGFSYRSIESIVGVTKPILAANGISVTPTRHEVISSEAVKAGSGATGFRVVVSAGWRIGYTDGSYIEASMLGEAIDYGDKATSKAVQMSYKYLLTQMLGIGSEDPDGESPEAGSGVSPPKEISKADQLAQRTNAVKAALLEEAKGDKEAAASVFTGIVEYLNLTEPFKTVEEIELVEKAATGDERPM